MKKFKKFVAVLCVVAFMCAFMAFPEASSTAYAADETDSIAYRDTEAYAFVSEFISACPERSDSVKEAEAAGWLKNKFDSVLPKNDNVGCEIVHVSNDGYITDNVVVRLKSSVSDGKQVIVGAHYDATAKSQGAGDNASGIAAMYLAMKQISATWTPSKLPFDVVFVAFGGEEQGLVGSIAYVASMKSKQLSDTLAMFNVDSIGFGDNLYLHCENKHTDFADYILARCASAKEKPYNKGIFTTAMLEDVFGYGYYETIQGSDHSPFRTAGVPTAFFFSGNYYGYDYVESLDDKRCVMNTAQDNLTNVDKYVGESYVANIQAVAKAITDCIFADDFVAVSQKARDEMVNLSVAYSRMYPLSINVSLVVVAALLFWLYYRKLQKRAVMGTAEIKTNRVFTQPDADDIFKLDK